MLRNTQGYMSADLGREGGSKDVDLERTGGPRLGRPSPRPNNNYAAFSFPAYGIFALPPPQLHTWERRHTHSCGADTIHIGANQL